MGLRELIGSVKKVFCGPKSYKNRWENEQKKINQELQDALYDQSKTVQRLKVTLEESVSAKSDKEIEVSQLVNENAELRNKILPLLELQQNFKRTDEAMNNLKLEIIDERSKNTDLRNDIKENEKKIAQLQESMAKNVLHLVAQENTMKGGRETMNDLRNEFKDAQTRIAKLEQSACNMLLHLSSTEKEVKHLKSLEEDCSNLTLEVQDLVKYKPHLPCPDSLMTRVSKCFFTPGHFDFEFNLKDVKGPRGFYTSERPTIFTFLFLLKRCVYGSDLLMIAGTSWRIYISRLLSDNHFKLYLFNEEESADYYVETELFLGHSQKKVSSRQRTSDVYDSPGYYEIRGSYHEWNDLFDTKNGYVDAKDNVRVKVNFWFKMAE